MKKNFLKEISEEEKNFILEMHIRKGYNTLNEENIFEDENQDVYNSLNKDPSAKNIARVIRNSNGGYLGDDKEAWAEAAFNKISDMETYNNVSTMLGQDVVEYLEDFLDVEETFHSKSIASHYNTIKQTAVKTSNLEPTNFTGKVAESEVKSYYDSVGKNNYVWQKLLILAGQNLGNFGPNKDGIDGDFGTKSKNALQNVTGSRVQNFNSFKKLFLLVSRDNKKAKEFQNFVNSQNKTVKKEKSNDDEILKKISDNSESDEEDDGYFSWIRKIFPNFSQLLDGKEMDESDFTDNQKEILIKTIKNSKKRVPSFVSRKKGGVTYVDYGENIAKEFENERGSPSTWDVLWRTVTKNDSFALATLLGKFDWTENEDGSYSIEDYYDFKDPKYKELIGVNRETLEGLSIQELSDKYNLTYYEAARTKGWVDHPETIPEKRLAINLTISDDSSNSSFASKNPSAYDPGKI